MSANVRHAPAERPCSATTRPRLGSGWPARLIVPEKRTTAPAETTWRDARMVEDAGTRTEIPRAERSTSPAAGTITRTVRLGPAGRVSEKRPVGSVVVAPAGTAVA